MDAGVAQAVPESGGPRHRRQGKTLETNPNTKDDPPGVQEGIEPGVGHVDVALLIEHALQLAVGHGLKGASVPPRVGSGTDIVEPRKHVGLGITEARDDHDGLERRVGMAEVARLVVARHPEVRQAVLVGISRVGVHRSEIVEDIPRQVQRLQVPVEVEGIAADEGGLVRDVANRSGYAVAVRGP